MPARDRAGTAARGDPWLAVLNGSAGEPARAAQSPAGVADDSDLVALLGAIRDDLRGARAALERLAVRKREANRRSRLIGRGRFREGRPVVEDAGPSPGPLRADDVSRLAVDQRIRSVTRMNDVLLLS